ncbi:MAG: hypothetical protein H5T71_00415, partial [Chloroflexi bacterium]|nr:hypothetical protein [Chloroflexota bacterium]
TAWAFEPYFSDAAGNKIGTVWEGQKVYIAIKDPDKGACGIDEFTADLVIFDFKTGAYVQTTSAVFRELGGIGSGLYFWVAASGSNTKVTVPIGSRANFGSIPYGMTHVMGTITPAAVGAWTEGAWEYVDENVIAGDPADTGATTEVDTNFEAFPRERQTARVSFQGFPAGSNNVLPAAIAGRFENMDTLVLIVADKTDERNIDQDQVKIVDTVAELTVPGRVDYGCGPSCSNIVVTIVDPDENLNCNEIEYVPFFVIINPGSWNPIELAPVTNFCNLMLRGGNYGEDQPYDEPIRWYNIYEPERYIQYGNAAWWNPNWTDVFGSGTLRAVFFAAETSVDSGVFTFDFGNLEDFQQALGLDPNDRLPPGTTIAFYYIDPNDYDDMDLATVQVGNRPLSQTFLTDANGIPVE